jgi:hypothetical protein
MDQEMTNRRENAALFNSPFEVGFRAIVLLAEMYPTAADLQRLVFLDYLLIHSGDVNGPPSLHPATPFRSQEYTVRRDVLRQGLLIMASRGLIDVAINTSGIEYSATESTIPFLDRLTTAYTRHLTERAAWVVVQFGLQTMQDLTTLFSSNVSRWGSEFMFMRDFSEDLSLLDGANNDELPA